MPLVPLVSYHMRMQYKCIKFCALFALLIISIIYQTQGSSKQVFDFDIILES